MQVHSRHLWLGNLVEAVTGDELRRRFGTFGEVEGVTTYPGRNYAFVNMATVPGAVAALGALNGSPLGGPGVRIEFAKTGTPSRALLVSHVSPQFTPDSWASQFATYGPVTQLQFNAAQASCRVEFATVAAAVHAHNSLQGQVIAGQALELSFTEGPAPPTQPPQRAPPPAQPPPRGASDALQPTRVVWVGLPNGSHVTKEELEVAFSPVGGLEAARTLMDRNYAFLEFRTVEDAARCIQRMQGYTLHTRASGPVRLTLKFSSASAAAVQAHPPPGLALQQPVSRARRGGDAPAASAAIAAQGGDASAAAAAAVAVAAVVRRRVGPNAAGGTRPRQWMASSYPQPEPWRRRRCCRPRCLAHLRQQPSTSCPSSRPPLVRPSHRHRRRGCPLACLRPGCWRLGADRAASCSRPPPCRSHSHSSQCRPWRQARPVQRSTQGTPHFRGRRRPRCNNNTRACRPAAPA